MTLLTGLPRALDLAQTDLAAIAARLDVVHTEAWLPAKPDHDRPTPHRPPDVDPDFVKGERWDCGQASYPAREAWTRMVDHLDQACATTGAVFELLCARQAPPVAACRPASLLDGRRVTRRLAGRLRGLQRIYGGMAPNEPRARWLADQLMGPRGRPAGTPCNHIELARYQVLSIVTIVGNGRKPPMCSACKRIGSIGQPRKGGQCDACYQRKYRLLARQRRSVVRTRQDAP